MAQASASASSSAANQNTGGAGSIGSPPNVFAWLIAGLVVLVLAGLWFKKGKR